MSPSFHRLKHRAGFTLLEIMLAVTILGIVIAAVFATWNSGLNAWKRSSNVSENFQRERIVMATLTDLTKSLVYAPSATSLYDVTYNHDAANGDTVSFVTASDLLLPPAEALAAGMRRVTIGLQRDQYGRPYLGIANAAALLAESAPGAEMHVLSADVCGFAVRFRDPRDGSWKDKWEEQNLMPSALEYTLGFGANDGRTPPAIVTRCVELPTAQYVLLLLGQSVSNGDTTNTTTRQDIPLATTESESGGGAE